MKLKVIKVYMYIMRIAIYTYVLYFTHLKSCTEYVAI